MSCKKSYLLHTTVVSWYFPRKLFFKTWWLIRRERRQKLQCAYPGLPDLTKFFRLTFFWCIGVDVAKFSPHPFSDSLFAPFLASCTFLTVFFSSSIFSPSARCLNYWPHSGNSQEKKLPICGTALCPVRRRTADSRKVLTSRRSTSDREAQGLFVGPQKGAGAQT